MERSFTKVACLASEIDIAQEALAALRDTYGCVSPEEAEVLVILGGDGFMLHSLHDYVDGKIPIYGMNLGSVGFLLNPYRKEKLLERINQAQAERLHPLRMVAQTASGEEHSAIGFNEVSLMRQTYQTAGISIRVDNRLRMEQLMCDGIMVATPAGSTAYNLSVRGPILPVGSNLLALTPISPFRPRRWHGALLPNTSTISFSVLDPDKRPVSATADFTEIRDVVEVTVTEDRTTGINVLFDRENTLQDRVFGEQFTP